jgi:hypothetical protein
MPGQTGATGAQGIPGAAGATGAQGPTGATGIAGATGAQGIPGEKGATGSTGQVATIDGSYPSYEELVAHHPTGNVGDAYIIGDDLWVWDQDKADWVNVGQIAGPQGLPGEPGATGATGAQGEPGLMGATGATGASGATGATGAAGDSGITGATGPGARGIPFPVIQVTNPPGGAPRIITVKIYGEPEANDRLYIRHKVRGNSVINRGNSRRKHMAHPVNPPIYGLPEHISNTAYFHGTTYWHGMQSEWPIHYNGETIETLTVAQLADPAVMQTRNGNYVYIDFVVARPTEDGSLVQFGPASRAVGLRNSGDLAGTIKTKIY